MAFHCPLNDIQLLRKPIKGLLESFTSWASFISSLISQMCTECPWSAEYFSRHWRFSIQKILLNFWDLCTSQFISDFLASPMQTSSIMSSLMKYSAFPSLQRTLQVCFQWETVPQPPSIKWLPVILGLFLLQFASLLQYFRQGKPGALT